MRPIGVILSCCLLLAACHKHVPVAVVLPAPPPAPPPPNVRTPPPVVTPLPLPVPKPPLVPPLQDANRAFIAGNYDEAAHLYEEYLHENPTGDVRDQALFNWAMSLALRVPAATDWTKVTGVLKELVDGYPKSPLKPPAEMILSQHSEIEQLSGDSKQKDQKIKQLNNALEQYKKADAGRKRP